jgi:ankyrin repeat protein
MNTWIEILKNDDYDSALKYIEDGADTNAANETGESVLAYAMRYRCSTDLVQLLIKSNADIFDFDDEGVSIFDMAVTYNNREMVQYLIEQGRDVNKTDRRSGFSALMAAACYGRNEIVQLLLEAGADKNARDSKGFTAIDFARKMNKKTILKLLDYDENSVKNTAILR